MARKAQPRTRSTTRPRRSSARIAQERAGRSGERATRRASAPSSSTKKKKKSAGRGTMLRRREARTEVRRGRFLLLIAFMGALGFTTIYLGEAALTAVTKLDVDGKGATLWDKLVDRMLDRDIPTSGRPPPKPTLKKKAPPPVQKEERVAEAKPAPAKPKLESLPRVPVPKTPRADLKAPSPNEYARTTAQPRVATREQAAEASRRRIDAILEKVGVER